MSPVTPVNLREVRRFPRVSGDEPPNKAWMLAAKWFSPRERG